MIIDLAVILTEDTVPSIPSHIEVFLYVNWNSALASNKSKNEFPYHPEVIITVNIQDKQGLQVLLGQDRGSKLKTYCYLCVWN